MPSSSECSTVCSALRLLPSRTRVSKCACAAGCVCLYAMVLSLTWRQRLRAYRTRNILIKIRACPESSWLEEGREAKERNDASSAQRAARVECMLHATLLFMNSQQVCRSLLPAPSSPPSLFLQRHKSQQINFILEFHFASAFVVALVCPLAS